MIAVIARERANAVGRQKFIFIEHVSQHAFQAMAVDQREKAARAVVGGFGFDVLAQAGSVFDEPLHAALEAGQVCRRRSGRGFPRRRAESVRPSSGL